MKLVIAGGGTGGHVFPALAVAEEFLEKDDTNQILFIGTKEGLEAQVVPEHHYPIHYIPKAPFVGKSFKEKIKTLSTLPQTIKLAKKYLKEFAPHAVLGVGGYASAPVLFAASRLKIPTFLQEQNAQPGLTNKILSYFAHHIFVSFESTTNYFSKSACVVTGNPVRKSFLNTPVIPRAHHKDFHIFVVGGSQGAHMVNVAVTEAVSYFKDLPRSIKLTHQTGSLDYEFVKKEYAEKKFQAEVLPFIADMASSYKEADLVIGRAGAGTVSELIMTETPSILIPYPYAKSHQIYNAEELEKKGATRVVLQQDLSGEKLFNIIKQLMTYEHACEKMKEALHSFEWGNPAEKIVNFITSYCKTGKL
ncbi:MAG: undecaprenyldiphospho-muramoylpentapeptide beta-N-acetylglucosaminyltransferase [Deltaproteobacteria bacterium]|nr:undecaprenyldiphospho-muramoylpentapeptide beta-N-acetylglucosaminyltransferase [Deltaproteobacteria bacterium]